MVVWVPKLSTDTEEAAARETKTLQDPRISFYWDKDYTTAGPFQKTLKLKGGAWDVYLIYPKGAEWSGVNPPPPAFWMHQLSNEKTGLRLDVERLVREAERILKEWRNISNPVVYFL